MKVSSQNPFHVYLYSCCSNKNESVYIILIVSIFLVARLKLYFFPLLRKLYVSQFVYLVVIADSLRQVCVVVLRDAATNSRGKTTSLQ